MDHNPFVYVLIGVAIAVSLTLIIACIFEAIAYMWDEWKTCDDSFFNSVDKLTDFRNQDE